MGKLKVASLFCGCGGMDLGLLGGFSFLRKQYYELPFEVVYAVDNDKYSAEIYNANFSYKCEVKDIKDIKAREVPNHDILIGGFPCQSFSIIAQNPPRLGYKDEKGKLFFEMVKILTKKQPRFFIAENVKGLLSANSSKAFPVIVKEFEKAGYYIKYKVLNASEFGVPQKRERVFIVGFKNHSDFTFFDFPKPTTSNGSKIKLGQVVNTSAPVTEKYYFSQRAVEGMLRVREKMNKGRVQKLEEPCNTISSHLAKVSLNGTDPVLLINNRYRRFTPKEASRIQSFPDSFNFEVVSENRQYKAIGNAVPPVLMWQVAKSLYECFIKEEYSKKFEVKKMACAQKHIFL